MLEFYNYSFIIILYFYPWCANSVDPERYTRTDIKTDRHCFIQVWQLGITVTAYSSVIKPVHRLTINRI